MPLDTASRTTAEWRALDNAHFIHPFTDHKQLHAEQSRIIVRADGIYLWDSEGTQILDGMAGLWCVASGYGRRELADAAAAQMRELPYYNSFFKTANPPAIALAARLAGLVGGSLRHAFFASSGSEAVDSAIRLARHYWILAGEPSRRIVISRQWGYHGSTIAGASAGGFDDMHRQAGDMPGFAQVQTPYWYLYGGDQSPDAFGRAAAKALEDKIVELGPQNVAAFIGEPIQGAGGVIIPPDSYWPEVQRICRKHGILLIADEVICGFGRTGKWFGSHTYGIEPDMMTLAKALTSGYVPLSAVMIGDRVADLLIEEGGEFYHGFTYSGHPVACAVAMANLDIFERENLVERSRIQGDRLVGRLREALADHPLVGEIRGKGLIGAIELVQDKEKRQFYPSRRGVGMICRNHCFANGLVMRAVRDSMVFAPPLTIDDDGIEAFVGLAKKAIDLTWGDLRKGG